MEFEDESIINPWYHLISPVRQGTGLIRPQQDGRRPVTGASGEVYLPQRAFCSHLEGGECSLAGAGLSAADG